MFDTNFICFYSQLSFFPAAKCFIGLISMMCLNHAPDDFNAAIVENQRERFLSIAQRAWLQQNVR